MAIKIISLDVWNTLISSSPEYAKEKDKYLSTELSLPIDTIRKAYQKVKNDSDKAAEQKSECLSNSGIYKKFLFLLERQDYDEMKLRHRMEKLFAKYPPHVLPKTIEYLNHLNNQGVKLSIASNTNFIRGKVLHNVILSKWRINWAFQVFSDQFNRPKPHPEFWRTVIKKAYRYVNAIPKEIIHVGDNKICDGSCSSHNIEFQHINKPNDLVHVLRGIS